MNLFTQYHSTYHGTQKQDAADLKGNHIVSKQYLSQVLDQPDASFAPHARDETAIVFQRCNEDQHQASTRQYRSELHPLAFLWLRFCIEVHEHNNEQEEYHDGASINNHVDDGQELSIHDDVMTSNGHEDHDQPQHTVDRILAEYHHHRAEQGQCGEEPKK